VLKASSFGGSKQHNPGYLKSESTYIDDMIKLIVSEKYETLLNLHQYSVEEFITLFEIIFTKTVNQYLDAENMKRNMYKK
jgi:hypothetical protein